MFHFLSWYLTITILGWLAFPLAWRLLPALADRGYSLSRALGLLLWAYIFWMMASLGLTRNNLGGLLAGLLVLTGLSAWALFGKWTSKGSPASIIDWLKSNLRMVIVVEVLFLAAFGFLAVMRAAGPEATGTEKPMELAFINAILRSPTFPPHDPWLSGYAISYYYFGYVMTAMLAKVTATPGSIAFNLMLSLVFGLGAIGAYGIIYNLLAKASNAERRTPVALPLLGPLFLLLVSNLEGFLEVLHRRGLFWTSSGFNFWKWLDMKELSQPPFQPAGWMPIRHWWWWRASRVVQDYDLAGNFREVIDEFPFFSYLLGDLHPHVLATPFSLLIIALALNVYLGGWRGEIRLPIARIHIHSAGLISAALVLGGIAFINTFEIVTSMTILLGAYLLGRVQEDGWNIERIMELVELVIPLAALAGVLYLPFYLGFASQAGGILPNLESPTRGIHLWVMFAPLFLPIFGYLLHLRRNEKRPCGWGGFISAASLILLLGVLTWSLSLLIQKFQPEFAAQYMHAQGFTSQSDFLSASLQRRLDAAGGWLTILCFLGGTLSLLIGLTRRSADHEPQPTHPGTFILLLAVIGGLLVLGPEFLYIRDQFGTRMNTIFKFYYQAWFLWSLAAAFGAAVLLQSLRGMGSILHGVGLAILMVMALTYPILGTASRTNNFKPVSGWTLDSAAYIQRDNPAEAQAIAFLKNAPDGIVAEAVGGSYTDYARVATHTGLPNVLGWPGHESQWRGGGAEMGSRQQDLETLYNTPSWSMAERIIKQYNIKYIFVGQLEFNTYRVHDQKFKQFLQVVFQQEEVTIYAVP